MGEMAGITTDVVSTKKGIGDWREDFEEWLLAGGRSWRTVGGYLQDMRMYEAWWAGVSGGAAFCPGVVTGRDMRAWREHTLAEARPATWNRRRATLKVFCRWAVEAGWVQYDPFQGVKGAREEEKPPKCLGRQEYGRLMRFCEQQAQTATSVFGQVMGARDLAMVSLMALAGLRVGEVCELRRDDLLLSERKGRVVVRMGKGCKRREVPLSSEARRAVEMYLSLANVRDGEPVFIGKGSARLTTRQVERVVGELGRVCDIGGLTPHALRHTFAKRTLDNGAALTVVQKLLGHERVETTVIYLRPSREDLERAVESL